jgi:hypothetical protein
LGVGLGPPWFYSCATVERAAKEETVEMANMDEVFMQVAEKRIGKGSWESNPPCRSFVYNGLQSSVYNGLQSS